MSLKRAYPDGGGGQAGEGAQWAEYELWLSCGGSNQTGQDEDGTIDVDGLDAWDARVGQVSLGLARTDKTVPPVGAIFPLEDPSQEDDAGIGPHLSFAKRRLQMYPGIKRIVIAPASVAGSGFNLPGGWKFDAGKSSLHDEAKAMVLDALVEDPRLTFMGEFLSLGVRDQTDPGTFQADVQAHVEDIREAVPGGDKAICLMFTLPSAELVGGSAGLLQNEASIRSISTWLERAAFVECADFTVHDGIHFDKESLRERGRRTAEKVPTVLNIARSIQVSDGLPSYRLQYDEFLGRYADTEGKVVEIVDAVYVADPQAERGTVLSPRGTGFETTLRLNGPEWSMAMWMNPKNTAGNQNLLSYKSASETIGQACAVRTIIHQGLTANNGGFYAENGNAYFALNTWHHLALTINGTVGTMYINGAAVGTLPAASIPVLSGRRQVRLAAWASNLTDSAFNGDIDDIVLASRALTAGEIAAIYNG